ncbi:LPXTG cell wall anchor domain-containing protein [Staphylococcus sciuri]|nr:LPXTG cell wall anchor domain-containing protein [Mammaliicoccus sciuri]NYS38495.1 LPXTG cell wall anchor domain-containing protein [Mammaliicoccus sciuri]
MQVKIRHTKSQSLKTLYFQTLISILTVTLIKKKKTKSETPKLPETGQSSKHYLNYLISALLICIASILFFIFKKKRSKQ